MAKNALQSLKKLFAAIGIKKPWEITGIASTPDYNDYLPAAKEYRQFSPGSPPVKAIIPHDIPSQIYDIKYYVRDYRRNNKYTSRAVTSAGGQDVSQMFADAPLKPEDIKYTPRPDLVNDRGY